MTDADRERVAQRAYELYLARGGVDGQAMEDGLNAERELNGVRSLFSQSLRTGLQICLTKP